MKGNAEVTKKMHFILFTNYKKYTYNDMDYGSIKMMCNINKLNKIKKIELNFLK